MLITPSNYYRIKEYINTGTGSYKDVLIWLWVLQQYKAIKTRQQKEYGPGILDRLYDNTAKWIDSVPMNASINLRKENRCSYCDLRLFDKNGVGDHIVGKELDHVGFVIPCCTVCNSSKGNRDLIEWIIKKEKSLDSLRIEVFSIYVRGKYRLLKQQYLLEDPPTDAHHAILSRLWGEVAF